MGLHARRAARPPLPRQRRRPACRDDARALASDLLGLLDRRPALRIVAAHGGGYLPFCSGRSDHAWRVRPDAQLPAHAPSDYLRRLFFDSLVYEPDALRALVAKVGSDRVLLGTDYPFDMGVEDPLERLRAAALDAACETAIRGGNAAAILGL